MNQQEVDHLVEVQVKTFHASWLVYKMINGFRGFLILHVLDKVWSSTLWKHGSEIWVKWNIPSGKFTAGSPKNPPNCKGKSSSIHVIFGVHVNIPGLSRWFKQALLYVPYFEGLWHHCKRCTKNDGSTLWFNQPVLKSLKSSHIFIFCPLPSHLRSNPHPGCHSQMRYIPTKL